MAALFFRHHFTTFTFMGLVDSYYGMILDCDLTSFQDVNVSDPARLLEPRDSVDGGKLDN